MTSLCPQLGAETRLTCVGVLDGQQVGCKGVGGRCLPGLGPAQQAPHHFLIPPQALLALLHILHHLCMLSLCKTLCYRYVQDALLLHARCSVSCKCKLRSCKASYRLLRDFQCPMGPCSQNEFVQKELSGGPQLWLAEVREISFAERQNGSLCAQKQLERLSQARMAYVSQPTVL